MKLHHTAIAVRDLDKALAHYSSHFSLNHAGEEVVEEQGVRVAFLSCGNTLLELITPLPGSEGGVSRFLEKKGEGLHHICFEVESVEDALRTFEKEGFALIDKAPRRGALGHLIAFLHPKDQFGTLVELVQHTETPKEL